MSQGRTHNEYIEELEEIHGGDIVALEEYSHCEEKIRHRCDICGHEWKTQPRILLEGHGCPECGKESVADAHRKSHSQYIEDLQCIHGNDIRILEEYQLARKKIKHKCMVCGHIWKVRPNLLLQGHGCPECRRREVTKSHEGYIDDLEDRFDGGITPVEKYINAHTKIKHRCNKCGYEWKVAPHSMLREGGSQGCPECVKKRLRNNRVLSDEEYRNKVENVHGDTIQVIEKYQDGQTKISHRCQECGHEWKITSHNILSGKGCPRCQQSHGERLVEKILTKMNINFEREVRFDNCRSKKPLPFDFGLKQFAEYIGMVEFDGRLHYKPKQAFGGEEGFWDRVQRDKIKDDFCLNNDIPLLRVNYMDKEQGRVEGKLKTFIQKVFQGGG